MPDTRKGEKAVKDKTQSS